MLDCRHSCSSTNCKIKYIQVRMQIYLQYKQAWMFVDQTAWEISSSLLVRHDRDCHDIQLQVFAFTMWIVSTKLVVCVDSIKPFQKRSSRQRLLFIAETPSNNNFRLPDERDEAWEDLIQFSRTLNSNQEKFISCNFLPASRSEQRRSIWSMWI